MVGCQKNPIFNCFVLFVFGFLELWLPCPPEWREVEPYRLLSAFGSKISIWRHDDASVLMEWAACTSRKDTSMLVLGKSIPDSKRRPCILQPGVLNCTLHLLQKHDFRVKVSGCRSDLHKVQNFDKLKTSHQHSAKHPTWQSRPRTVEQLAYVRQEWVSSSL